MKKKEGLLSNLQRFSQEKKKVFCYLQYFRVLTKICPGWKMLSPRCWARAFLKLFLMPCATKVGFCWCVLSIIQDTVFFYQVESEKTGLFCWSVRLSSNEDRNIIEECHQKATEISSYLWFNLLGVTYLTKTSNITFLTLLYWCFIHRAVWEHLNHDISCAVTDPITVFLCALLNWSSE